MDNQPCVRGGGRIGPRDDDPVGPLGLELTQPFAPGRRVDTLWVMRNPLHAVSIAALVSFDPGCEDQAGGEGCIDIGCSSSLEITVTDDTGATVGGLYGTIVVGEHEFAVDCREPGYQPEGWNCTDSGGISLDLDNRDGDGAVRADLMNDMGQLVVVTDAEATWDPQRPGGPGCGVYCWWGTIDLTATSGTGG